MWFTFKLYLVILQCNNFDVFYFRFAFSNGGCSVVPSSVGTSNGHHKTNGFQATTDISSNTNTIARRSEVSPIQSHVSVFFMDEYIVWVKSSIF